MVTLQLEKFICVIAEGPVTGLDVGAISMKGTKVLTLGAGREVLPHNMAVTKM